MNLLIIIFFFLFVSSLTDFVYPNQKKIHEQLYKLAFGVTYILFTIKYYYGADIYSYVNVYDTIEDPMTLLTTHSYELSFKNYFEPGFLLFCSVSKYIGLSYWMMTVVISTIYFYSLNSLLNKIYEKKIFALFLIVILDFNLIFAAFRQCLAVSFFMLTILAYIDKKYLKTIIFFLLILTMHKSAFFACVFFIIAISLDSYKASRANYYLLTALLFLFLLFSFSDIIYFIVTKLNLPENIVASVKHHLLLGQKIQSVFVLYFLGLFAFALYYRKSEDKTKEHRFLQWLSFIALLFIVFLYQNYYLLNRIRSYFIPVVVVFLFLIIKESSYIQRRKYILFQELALVVIYVFLSTVIIRRAIEQNNLKSGIYETSTVFSRFTKSEEEIKREQLKKADFFWKNEFKQNINKKE